jgi:hypothetical protein
MRTTATGLMAAIDSATFTGFAFREGEPIRVS